MTNESNTTPEFDNNKYDEEKPSRIDTATKRLRAEIKELESSVDLVEDQETAWSFMSELHLLRQTLILLYESALFNKNSVDRVVSDMQEVIEHSKKAYEETNDNSYLSDQEAAKEVLIRLNYPDKDSKI